MMGGCAAHVRDAPQAGIVECLGRTRGGRALFEQNLAERRAAVRSSTMIILNISSTPTRTIIMTTTNPISVASARAKATFRPMGSPLTGESRRADSGLFSHFPGEGG